MNGNSRKNKENALEGLFLPIIELKKERRWYDNS